MSITFNCQVGAWEGIKEACLYFQLIKILDRGTGGIFHPQLRAGQLTSGLTDLPTSVCC